MIVHLRDTVFGQLVRLCSAKQLLQFPDEKDPSVWKQFITHATLNLPAPESSDPSQESIDETQTNPSNREHVRAGKGNVSDSFSSTPTQRDPPEKVESCPDNGIILVDWYGDIDPENPQDWSRGRKFGVFVQICILNFGIYIGSSIYTPGELNVMEEFHTTEVVATLGLSLFVLGYGLGPMLFSPMSEVPKIGRSRIYFWTLFAFVLLQLPTGYAVNMPMLAVFRFLTGFFGGPVLATGGATIIDMYPPQELAFWMGIYGSVGVLGPVMGPLVGGFAAQAQGWRWAIWVLTWLCTVVLSVLFVAMPETNSANILYRRAKRLRKATGNVKLKSRSEMDAAEVTFRDHLAMLGRAFTLTFSEPVVFFVDLYSALLYGILYIWFESFPIVFGEIYGFNTGQQGLVFLGICVGGFVTVPCYLFWIKKRLIPSFQHPPIYPEIVLPPTFFGAFALPICLFWYGWTSRGSIHWIVPIVGSGSFTVSIVTLFMPILTYLGMAYPQYAASVLAGNTLFRAASGTVFPLFARALFRNLGIGPGNSLLGGLAILFIPIPFGLYYRGGRIRHRSKNATHDV